MIYYYDTSDHVYTSNLIYINSTFHSLQIQIQTAAFDFNGKLPSSRIHQTVVATSDFVLVYGGYSRNGTFLGDINLYYMRTQR